MFVLIHVIIALASMLSAAIAYVQPSVARLRLSRFLIASTLISGSYLVWQTHAALTQACLTGLAYLGGMILATLAAKKKLARSTNI